MTTLQCNMVARVVEHALDETWRRKPWARCDFVLTTGTALLTTPLSRDVSSDDGSTDLYVEFQRKKWLHRDRLLLTARTKNGADLSAEDIRQRG